MIRFLADAMLGKLVRWLRILGYDTEYLPLSQDADLLQTAADDDRTLLTRDVALHREAVRRGVGSILLQAHSIRGQLKELSPTISLSLSNSRCPICNGELALNRVGPKAPRPLQPPASRGEMWHCVCCGKIYWNGRHWDSITEILADISR